MTEKRKKVKGPIVVAPRGIAKYAWLNKPDMGFDGKGEGSFKIRVLLDDTDDNRAWCDDVIEKGKKAAVENAIKLKKQFKHPFRFPEDQDEDDYVPQDGKDKPKLDEDHKGRIFFEAKSKFKPATFDAKKEELPEDVSIMSGDIQRTKFEVLPYEGLGSGLSFRLAAVQLIEKNTSYSGGNKASADGFDEEEGYESGGRGDNNDNDEQF